MGDYLTFKKMITPIIIQVLFWLAAVVIVLAGLLSIFGGLVTMTKGSFQVGLGIGQAVAGFIILIFGPIVVRIYAEILVVIFRINETLTEISQSLRKP